MGGSRLPWHPSLRGRPHRCAYVQDGQKRENQSEKLYNHSLLHMKILKVFKMTLEEFTAYPENPQKDVINIPVYEQAFSAGRGQEFGDSSEIIDYVALPNELKKYTDNMRASYVRGDSMEPTLFDNDIILYDSFGYDGTDGIYAINYRGASFVKRLQRAKDFVRIISDNKKYDEMTESGESEDFRVIGKVRYVVHKVQG